MNDSTPRDYPRVSIFYRDRFEADPGMMIPAFSNGYGAGFVRVISNDTPYGPLVIELGPDLAPHVRAELLP